jgi:predicted nucleotidyltransferase
MIGSLTQQEEKALLEFKRKVLEAFPDKIVKVLLYGSKARGDCNANSDIDIIVITNVNDWRLGDEIRKIGYSLDELLGYKFSIQAIPESRIRYMQENNFQFIRNILSDGIAV